MVETVSLAGRPHRTPWRRLRRRVWAHPFMLVGLLGLLPPLYLLAWLYRDAGWGWAAQAARWAWFGWSAAAAVLMGLVSLTTLRDRRVTPANRARAFGWMSGNGLAALALLFGWMEGAAVAYYALPAPLALLEQRDRRRWRVWAQLLLSVGAAVAFVVHEAFLVLACVLLRDGCLYIIKQPLREAVERKPTPADLRVKMGDSCAIGHG